jgi:hypothetical protein
MAEPFAHDCQRNAGIMQQAGLGVPEIVNRTFSVAILGHR